MNWQASFNAGQAAILKKVYNQTSDENKAKIDSLESALLDRISTSNQSLEASISFGRNIANAIFEWAKTDGGHRAYLRNFEEFEHPTHKGHWQPPLFAQSFSHNPLHPYWGSNRTFVKVNADLPIPAMIPYDTARDSPYFKQFEAVYNKDKELTQTEKEIALWWGDDPDDTFTPPGHSFYITSLVVEAKKPDLAASSEAFARVGLSVADAFINCWKWKYHHFTERPNTFIPAHIEEQWESFWPDPPFPSFPSGHAIQAAAAARSLEHIFGENFHFVDSSHVGRERDEVRDVDFKARTFDTFWEFAEETANSRFYGGIHIPHDNKVGLEEGARIADNVSKLKWRSE
jgi:hypothetical protein